ncbi:ABC transporter ATP-binding protein [Actibacterium mucosum KCTC 23349]|uniref:ABC transporter ATP-binding protein n=1 Tax=Actibacterium mucosum KCTC 23349 TaxID=1454373 RepID=A0A037ZNI5_9RHOB|nr:ABC transporter ATP-binding protein [Actibacterium mucosum]KAJ57103.1 ABC transporter ATP-binding protein [Actibacterium mucosum KCTC 23349]
MTTGKSIHLRSVHKAWGEAVSLRGIDLEIPANKFTTILGPSGCGKSTTLRIIAGLEEATSGTVEIGGADVTTRPASGRDIAMVFQSYALFPHLSVAENIVFGLRVRRMGRAERDAKLKQTAEMLGLSHLLDRKPSQLSGGQQQRVALGRAIVADKSIFLMDEPLSNLDAKLRTEMREEIRDLQKRLGVTMVYVTHDQVEAVTMADQIVLMNEGRIEQIATPREIYSRPETLFTAKFIGTPPMGTCRAGVLGVARDDITLGVRPEALMIDPTGPINATISHIEYLGADAMIDCRIGDQVLPCRVPGRTELAIGARISLSVAPDDLHAFDTASGRRLDEFPPEFAAFFSSQTTAPKGPIASSTER